MSTIEAIRERFYKKKLCYACSYDSTTILSLLRFGIGTCGVRASVAYMAPEKNTAPEKNKPDQNNEGNLFHIMDEATVLGVDGLQHDSPVAQIVSLEEGLCFELDDGMAQVSGRASFVVGTTDAERENSPHLFMTYKGSLRFRYGMKDLFGSIYDKGKGRSCKVTASAWIVPSFFTTDSRYKWLSEVGCVAFGRWTAESENHALRRKVTTELDIYTCGVDGA